MTELFDHPYQLRQIGLRDFKSVAEAEVNLKPLTCVVGANSSGKSTLLQSILAVTQAVRAGMNSNEFPLNGGLVRLGTFDETRNFLAEDRDSPVQIGFRFADTHFGPSLSPRQENESQRYETSWRAYLDADESAGATLGGSAQIRQLEFEIELVEASAGQARTRLASCDLSEIGSSTDPRADWLQGGAFGQVGLAVPASGRVQNWDSGESNPVDAIVLVGGIPRLLAYQVGQLDFLMGQWWGQATRVFGAELSSAKQRVAEADSSASDEELEKEFAALVAAAKDDIEAFERDANNRIGQFGSDRRFESVGDRTWLFFDQRQVVRSSKERAALAEKMVAMGERRFRSSLRKEFETTDSIEEQILTPIFGGLGNDFSLTGVATERFFSDQVRYLGPLRAAPKAVYDPGPSTLDLGTEGQYSAGVLHAQAGRVITMPMPEGSGEEAVLAEALNFWLQRFGLADGASSQDQGRMGIGLSVTPAGGKREVDLTSVGVGVSQVLPVLLLCLLAEPGALVVVEQPELHLHPRLEQELADFFLACVRSGRQVVLETHSEHLVNRLRYRIAQDETTSTHDLVGLVFAESDGGVTSYREPEINEYGGIGDDWPAGFLDLSVRESQELVRAALAKRKRENESDDEG